MLRAWLASGVAATAGLLIILIGFAGNRQVDRDILYTAPHAEMAPFQRVWNPDTNSDYSISDFSKEPDGVDDDDDSEKKLCGEDGSKCPELPAFNGEDYFDSKPIG
jgi:hypothetical protein